MVSHPCAGLGAPRTPRLSLCAACPRESSYAARVGGSFAAAAAAGGGSAEGRAPSEVFTLTPMPAPPGCAVVWAPFSTRFSFAVGGAAPAEGESTLPAWGGGGQPDSEEDPLAGRRRRRRRHRASWTAAEFPLARSLARASGADPLPFLRRRHSHPGFRVRFLNLVRFVRLPLGRAAARGGR